MRNELLNALAEVEGLLDQGRRRLAEFTWDGREWPCVAIPGTEGQKFDFGGFTVELDTKLRVRQDVFRGRSPQRKDKLVYKGKTLRVEAIEVDPMQLVYIYHCVNPSKGV